MKKRDFLKIIAGLFAVPVIGKIKPSNDKKIDDGNPLFPSQMYRPGVCWGPTGYIEYSCKLNSVNKDVSYYGDGRLISKVINVEPWGDCKINYWEELDSTKLT